MRLVTWNLGHPLDGGHALDAVMMALTALEPDVAILTEHLAATAHRSFLLSLAGGGFGGGADTSGHGAAHNYWQHRQDAGRQRGQDAGDERAEQQ